MRIQTIPILFVFLMMGVADAMGPMSEAVRENYELSNVTATLLSFFVFIAFAVFSVPGGLLAARIGKKRLLLLGLGLNAIAMLIPCLTEPTFAVLLGCIFVLGIGTTFLQVAGNPIMHDVSAEGKYGRNLSFAQGFKGIGSSVSSYLVTAVAGFAIFKTLGWRGVFPIFFVLMAAAFIWVCTIKVNETKADVPPSLKSGLGLLKKPVYALAVLGIFLYVGSEVCMARFLLPLLEKMGLEESTATKFGPAFFFLMLTVGRLGGGAVLNFLSQRTFFRLSALMGLVGALILMFGASNIAVIGVLLSGLGFANIWPMLFSITVEKDPARGSELSGLMCMAISGGALVPLLMGQFVDMGLGTKAFIVPVVCFVYLLVLSLEKDQPKQIEPESAASS
ncbi:L-fucose transporter [Sedimentisphaera cyanobacteriorum]|uniref:L-fucose transporter n=1 Tax=Sedimentisphaera cyanobacteriorum TaxID=1940790 RepID=A0A1Q2HSF0_9BACT|nr:MFS transporter [Sedimentisphaera cyanobacteriorum]AQQ08866.1 L-fucose transporter [Sedimentisphaera cyanobacteriorum]AQQ10300.1 L-fucose transporter [Sedimentisphaera cyanobacteriorum]